LPKPIILKPVWFLALSENYFEMSIQSIIDGCSALNNDFLSLSAYYEMELIFLLLLPYYTGKIITLLYGLLQHNTWEPLI
jgi:hypothetical protein